MKLDIQNHIFLTDVALRLKVEQDHMIDIFNTVTMSLVNADSDAQKSIASFKVGKISEDQLDSDMNTIGDLLVVQSAYDKLSDAYIQAFDAVSSYHISRMENDPDCTIN